MQGYRELTQTIWQLHQKKVFLHHQTIRVIVIKVDYKD